MIIGAQERVDALRGSAHIVVGLACSVISLIMLPRARQLCEVFEYFVERRSRRSSRRRLLRGIKRQRRRSPERGAHQHDRAKHVRPQQGAIGGNGRTEIVSDHGRGRAMAERRDKPQCIPARGWRAKRSDVALRMRCPSGGTPRSPFDPGRRCDSPPPPAAARPPSDSQLREAVEKHDQGRPSPRSRLQHVHREPLMSSTTWERLPGQAFE